MNYNQIDKEIELWEKEYERGNVSKKERDEEIRDLERAVGRHEAEMERREEYDHPERGGYY